MPAAFRWTQCSLLLLVGHVAARFGLRPSSEYGVDPAVVAASIRAATEAMRRREPPAHGTGVLLHLGEDADRAQKRQHTDEEDEVDSEDEDGDEEEGNEDWDEEEGDEEEECEEEDYMYGEGEEDEESEAEDSSGSSNSEVNACAAPEVRRVRVKLR